MTPQEAYKNYYRYCRDTETWTWDFIKDNLKKTYIDFEEFNFEEFKDKICCLQESLFVFLFAFMCEVNRQSL